MIFSVIPSGAAFEAAESRDPLRVVTTLLLTASCHTSGDPSTRSSDSLARDDGSFAGTSRGTPHLSTHVRSGGGGGAPWDAPRTSRTYWNSSYVLRGQLEQALSEIKTLEGILPICAHCKKIRTDDGYWEQVEGYVSKRSSARFSHGICPSCRKEHYADFIEGS